MMMTMIVFNKQQHITTVSRQMIAAVRVQVKSGVDGDWYCIGCQNDKKYPPIPILSNTCEYCPVPNNPIPVSF